MHRERPLGQHQARDRAGQGGAEERLHGRVRRVQQEHREDDFKATASNPRGLDARAFTKKTGAPDECALDTS